jgi:molybdenum cofactor cytidylyltransferase
MRFGKLATGEAIGAVLAHTLRAGGRVYKKGRVLDAAAVAALREAGYAEVTVARLEPGDVAEDTAASRVAAAVAGAGVRAAEPFTGRCNLVAEARGLVRVDEPRVSALNRIHESMTVATVAPWALVEAGALVATVKVIPFAASEEVVAASCAVGPLVSLAPLARRAAGVVLTRLPQLSERLLDGPSESLRARMLALGGEVAREIRCGHDEDQVAAAIRELAAAGLAPILLLGASAVTDRGDVIPAAIVRAGGEVERLGMPVDPGNLLVLGRLGEIPVVGVPGCARSAKPSGFDWVLQRLCAGLPVGAADVGAMGVGGLLDEVAARGQPRAGKPSPGGPTVAALVLAAGSSRRMGANKLLLEVDGAPMVARAVDAARGSRARRVLVVTGHDADRVRAALAGRAVELVHNPDHLEGMASSLRAGIAALGGVDGAVVCLGDMPWVRTADIDALIAAFDPAAGREICVAQHDGKRGNPVLWGARHFAEILRLSGDRGARALLEEHAGSVVGVDVGHPGVLLDVDTRDALVEHSGS